LLDSLGFNEKQILKTIERFALLQTIPNCLVYEVSDVASRHRLIVASQLLARIAIGESLTTSANWVAFGLGAH